LPIDETKTTGKVEPIAGTLWKRRVRRHAHIPKKIKSAKEKSQKF